MIQCRTCVQRHKDDSLQLCCVKQKTPNEVDSYTFVIYITDELSSELPLLFTDGRLGERAGGESSSELATVLMASW